MTGNNSEDQLAAKFSGNSMNPAELIAYQEDSVVSKTIVDKETGNVTLFAFAQGQGLSEHTAQYDALVYILDGEADITISGKAVKAKQGEMVLMSANQPHSLKAREKFKMLLVMIKS